MRLQRLLAVLAVATGLSATAIAADSSAPAAAFPHGHYAALNQLPDWGGVWTYDFMPPPGTKREMPALKGKYLADYQAWQNVAAANHGEVPHQGSYCRPPGMPGIMLVGQYPIELLFTPGRVTIHHEAWMQLRSIWTDGRGHPDDWDPTFYGHSIGHWEGQGESQTLVVDTVGIKTITELRPGMGHSDKLHIIERFHLSKDNKDTLVDDMLVEDPEALEHPWHAVLNYTRARDQDLMEFECAENDRNPVDAHGNVTLK